MILTTLRPLVRKALDRRQFPSNNTRTCRQNMSVSVGASLGNVERDVESGPRGRQSEMALPIYPILALCTNVVDSHAVSWSATTLAYPERRLILKCTTPSDRDLAGRGEGRGQVSEQRDAGTFSGLHRTNTAACKLILPLQ